jgi:hypothetical protein
VDEDPLCRVCETQVNMGDTECDEHYVGLWWVTVYSVTQCYGGAEEGGWWFDVGEVLCNVPFETVADARVSTARLLRMFSDPRNGYKDQYGKTSVMNGNDISTRIGRTPGQNFPVARPSYE